MNGLSSFDGSCFSNGTIGFADTITTACINLSWFLTPTRSYRTRCFLPSKGIKRCPHYVVRVRGAKRLCNDILDAEHLEDGAHCTTGDDAGAWRGCADNNTAGTVTAFAVMVERAALAKVDPDQTTTGSFVCLTDRLWNFACLAVTKANTAFQITNNNESCKAEPLTTLDRFRDAIDMHQFIGEFTIFAITAATTSAVSVWTSCHCVCLS
ncbi:MAG: hypothetical protein ACI9XZ_001402 [Alphaproteobacteria bacterium]|jgi:hypothetical protein